jgi:hypothetical protein
MACQGSVNHGMHVPGARQRRRPPPRAQTAARPVPPPGPPHPSLRSLRSRAHTLHTHFRTRWQAGPVAWTCDCNLLTDAEAGTLAAALGAVTELRALDLSDNCLGDSKCVSPFNCLQDVTQWDVDTHVRLTGLPLTSIVVCNVHQAERTTSSFQCLIWNHWAVFWLCAGALRLRLSLVELDLSFKCFWPATGSTQRSAAHHPILL